MRENIISMSGVDGCCSRHVHTYDVFADIMMVIDLIENFMTAGLFVWISARNYYVRRWRSGGDQ